MEKTSDVELLELLQKKFGFKQFKPGQRETIEALLENKRILSIQPTGYGKSLIYQLSSLLVEGMTLVISPLLALVRDQLSHLDERFGIAAAAINSDQSEEKNEEVKELALTGKYRILFIAPEQLDNLVNFQFLLRLPVGLLVVDEAHCISMWGHDFRPSYRLIVNAVREFEQKNEALCVLGLTATANQKTEQDIARQLQNPQGQPLRIFRSSMDRPNISLSIVPVKGVIQKLEILGELLPRMDGCGILYCSTRDQTELVADYLKGRGQNVVSYHAGYTPEQKIRLQQEFIRGTYQAIAATNALGMGIDKPDIRYIVHVDLPGSITAYYQEVGRAGRDDKPAWGFLLFDEHDRRIQEHFIRTAQPSREDFDKVLQCIQSDEAGSFPNATKIRVWSGLHPTKVTVILSELIEQKLVVKEINQKKQVYRRTDTVTDLNLDRYRIQQSVRQKELEAILSYGKGAVDCLMHGLRSALGDTESSPCGRCSLCRPEDHSVATASRGKAETREWLSTRELPILAVKRPEMSEGIAVLNGELRSELFVSFMRKRSQTTDPSHGRKLSKELCTLLMKKITLLAERYRIGSIVPLPSRTWLQREFTAHLIKQHLKVPVHEDLLVWDPVPAARQGELLNNDQRRENVRGKMKLTVNPSVPGPGAILLLDDYIGSGATLKEAARALRQQGNLDNEIVPLAIARIRWRIGAKGII
ncbi:MAG: RecQ family ATP-dependent DNA helicase [Proteobacteria bacterium]|nr:RecQ family ATP-dependent DNA helicase [Pseudomonadota bacterium]